MILRPWKRIRDLERSLRSVVLVVDALQPPRRGDKGPPPAKTVLRSDLLKLAAAGKMVDRTESETIARGACVVRLERKLSSS